MKAQERNCFDINNLTIWVGAGISIKEPSCLPSGNQLTRFVLENMILEEDKLLKIWNQINDYENKYLETSTFPRLELVLSSIAFVEKNFVKEEGIVQGAFLKGLSSFDEVPINENHMLLATLVHAGACVMTANFDLGIERAYEKLFSQKCKKNKIVHFHGTNSSKDKIGATIENITHFVNKAMEQKVRKNFKNNRTNYFLGYSFSDMYDINAMILKLYSDFNSDLTKENWICNHIENNFEGDSKLEQKVKRFFGKGNVHVFKENTTHVLKELCKTYSVNEQYIKIKKGEKTWKDLFLEKTVITREFQVLSTIHLLNRMGIAIDKLDIKLFKMYEEINIENVKKREIFEFHFASYSEYWFNKYGKSRLKTKEHINELGRRQMDSELKVNFEDGYSNKKADDIIRHVNKENFILYDDFRGLSRRIHLLKLLMVNENVEIDISEIIKLIEIFSSYSVGKFIDINLYASLFRYKMYLSGLKEKCSKVEINYNLQQANEIYYDIGSVEGIISTRLDYFIIENYRKESSDRGGIFSTSEWENLKKLCDATGQYRYKKMLIAMEKSKVVEKYTI